MKLRLHWKERYEMVREFPSFELDSDRFPELEMEMLHVHSAGSLSQQQQALADLEYKMHHAAQGGESIFQLVGPYNDLSEANVYPLTQEAGSLSLVDQGRA